MSYAEDHASAHADVADAGAVAIFTRTGKSYDEDRGVLTHTTNGVVPCVAMQVKSRPEQYAALGLSGVEALTLFTVADTYGQRPVKGDTVPWAGQTYTVKFCEPFQPNGKAIFTRAVVAR